MATTAVIKPRRWSVHVSARGGEPLQLRCGSEPLTQRGPGTLEAVSPVELLLLSIATCFALSCRMALGERAAPPFEVSVHGEKAAEVPSRLAAIDITVAFPGLASGDAAQIAAQAKQLCTVTNTLAHPPRLTVALRDDSIDQ